MRKIIYIALFLVSCETEMERQARKNDREVEKIMRELNDTLKHLDRVERLMNSGYTSYEADSILKRPL